MEDTKLAFLHGLFQQIEGQVQFGDSKASLLVAGDGILLAVSGGLIKLVSGCKGDDFNLTCVFSSVGLGPWVSLGSATTAALLLTVSLACALLAGRPAGVHDKPPAELFLLSYIARMDPDEFAKQYADATPQDLAREALRTIHGKARYATRKFRLLKHAVDLILLSLGLMVVAIVVAIGVGFPI